MGFAGSECGWEFYNIIVPFVFQLVFSDISNYFIKLEYYVTIYGLI